MVRLLVSLILGVASIAMIYHSHLIFKELGVGQEDSQVSFHPSFFICPIICYISVASTAISFIAWQKYGWNNLKSYGERGLFYWLTYGLIVGLVFGVVFEFVWVVVFGFVLGLILELVLGLVFGFVLGPVFGLVFGLVWGLIEEFE
ncbi:MAG: hypothetical protein IH845_00755 [Nanoarchaeota archaeon]|nr:hypothetical protein [Nanoarchaeota archaeon]